MALTATVTKKSVAYMMPDMWSVSINVVLFDGSVEVWDRDYSVRYRAGDTIEAKQAKLIEMAKADIDKYKSEQMIFDAPAFDDVVANIQTALTASLEA